MATNRARARATRDEPGRDGPGPRSRDEPPSPHRSVSNDSCDCLPSNLAPPNDYCAVSENRCAGCGGNWCAGDPEPSPKPTEAVPSPRPSARPTNEGESAFPTVEGDAVIAGYVENWEDFSDFSQYGAYTTLLYSFLTLDAAPDHLSPREISWTGSAIYETMTRVDVLEVMADTGFSNPYNWMRRPARAPNLTMAPTPSRDRGETRRRRSGSRRRRGRDVACS